jgi:hypothetical protein
MRFTKTTLIAGLLAAGLAAAPAAADSTTAAVPATAAVPTATALLFENAHFDKLPDGTVISYRYERDTVDPTKLGGAFEDDIKLTLGTPGPDGRRDIVVQLFSGERRKPAGPFSQMLGNPLVMLFLEADVNVMKELVGGNPRYLRNKIRAAFRAGGDVEATTVTVDGVEVPAERIVLRPFLDDSHRTELGAFVEKTYEFVVSDKVPGSLVSIRAVTPQLAGTGEPYLEEEIRYVGSAPKG